MAPKTIKNVAPQCTIVSLVASGSADDPSPTGLHCCSRPMDFSRACFGQESSAEPASTEGEAEREAGLGFVFPRAGDLFVGKIRHMAQKTLCWS